MAALDAAGVGTRHVTVLPGVATGVALILVEAGGENVIAVAPGANRGLEPDRIAAALASAPDPVG